MDDKKINHELDTKQWKDLSSSAPELAPVSDKQAILEDEKHVVPGNAPEVVEEKSFPQAIDDEGDKEGCTASSTSSSSDEKIPIETTANKVKKSRKLRRALIIGGVSTIIVTIALGVGLGVGLTKKISSSPTMYYEARAIGSITTPPPTGSYSLTLQSPKISNSSCLISSSQKAAWSCDLVPTSTFNISVGAFQGTQLGAVIQPLKSENATLQYGAQISDLAIRYTQFLSVEDTEHPDLGPAWFFQDTYDKVVLLPETSFQKDNTEISDGALKAGDKPWLCTFNSTIVQGFLYVDQEQQTTASSSSSVTDPLEQFPLLVKFEERRDAKDRRVPVSSIRSWMMGACNGSAIATESRM